jgi:hypothetical protein
VTDEPGDTYPVAYCAPGNREAAEAVLAARGETVARIVEHPWLEGTEGIYIAREPRLDLTALLPVTYDFGQPESELRLLRFREMLRYGALVSPPYPIRLSSVI